MFKIIFIDFILTLINIVTFFVPFQSINKSDLFLLIGKDRGWPACLIYIYNLPPIFNENLLNKVRPQMFSPYDQNYQLIIEYNFSKMINQIPILTNNIERASFVYMNFYPGFTLKAGMTLEEYYNISRDYFLFLKNNKLLNKRIFMLTVRPFTEIYTAFLIGFKGCYELMSKNGKWFVVPYLSHFPNYPSDLYIHNNRTISVFFSGSLRANRAKLESLLTEINNSYYLVFKRSDKNVSEILYNMPRYFSKSKYCIIPRGDSASSKRFYDAVMYGCIPIIISDSFHLPFDETQIFWEKCTIKIKNKNIEELPKIINNITDNQYQKMFNYLLMAREFIRFDNGITSNNGVGSILWELFYRYQFIKDKNVEINKKEIDIAEKFLEFGFSENYRDFYKKYWNYN